jgi:hypothetical protein
MSRKLILLATILLATNAAQARIHSLPAFQDITPRDVNGDSLDPSVGIDGDSIILVMWVPGGTQTRLLRQGPGGRWAQTHVLSNATLPLNEVAYDVAMKNGIAAVRISTHRILIFERINNDWLQTDALDNLDYTGKLVVSGARILVGAVGCTEGPDAFIFEKNASTARWQVTGRIVTSAASCNTAAAIDLNNSTAMIHFPGTSNVGVYRRNGSALDWVASGGLALPADPEGLASPGGSMALQGSVAVAPGASYFSNASGYWTLAGRIVPVDFATNTGHGYGPVYRDGILLSADSQDDYYPRRQLYVYAPNTVGGFDHVAILRTGWDVETYDVSGRTVVASSTDYLRASGSVTEVFTLPAPLAAPDAIAQDFESRDVSGFTQEGNAGFALTGAGPGYVFRSAAGGDAIAVVNDSQWRGYENVEADIKPLAVASGDPWLGLALRYADTNNYYLASIRGSNRLRLERRVNASINLIAEVTFPFRLNETRHFTFTADGKHLTAVVSSSEGRAAISADDTTFGAGSVALMTSRARVDFDNVLARPTPTITIANKGYRDYDIYGRPWTFSGGHWDEAASDGSTTTSDSTMKQTDSSGSASAVIGVPVKDQNVVAYVRLDSFGSTNPVSSFNLLARYVDARTYYSLSVRSSGQMQIRKTVGGTTTVLKSGSFAPGADYKRYELRVVGRELHAFADGALILAAQDGDIAAGIYGLSTYRAAISTWQFDAHQP